ncbi:MAG TPA: hypothetical protein VMH87_15265 [Pseudomonadales bacterium]|nr:hypothetical protein [Pseudomonadales bacterium]
MKAISELAMWIMTIHPFFFILFSAIVIWKVLPYIFKAFGGGRLAVLKLEDRIGAILFLVCAVVMTVISFWYPVYLCAYYSSPDDRYGFALLFASPFWFVSAGISCVAFHRLSSAVASGQRTIANYILIIGGTLLALLGLSPFLFVLWRILNSLF